MTIDEDALEFDEDVRLFEGQPFTGVARSVYPNGKVRNEMTFCHGFEDGVCRSWHSNGQLSREWHATRGVVNGKEYEWHESGAIKSVGYYVHGVELTFDKWNESGRLIENRSINWNTSLGAYAKQLLP